MNHYPVEVQFKKGPAFSIEVEASSMLQASEEAVRQARIFGFDDKVKKVVVRPAGEHVS